MSKRSIFRNVTDSRRKAYSALETSGESQQALWQALQALTEQGIDLGPKAAIIIEKRANIKKRAPK
jgi:hypothetical protein